MCKYCKINSLSHFRLYFAKLSEYPTFRYETLESISQVHLQWRKKKYWKSQIVNPVTQLLREYTYYKILHSPLITISILLLNSIGKYIENHNLWILLYNSYYKSRLTHNSMYILHLNNLNQSSQENKKEMS